MSFLFFTPTAYVLSCLTHAPETGDGVKERQNRPRFHGAGANLIRVASIPIGEIGDALESPCSIHNEPTV